MGADPERVEAAVGQMEAEPHRFVPQAAQDRIVRHVTRARVLSSRTGSHTRRCSRRDHASLAVEHLDAQLAVRPRRR